MNAWWRLGRSMSRAAVFAGVMSGVSPALAKRGPPPDVPPVVDQGIRYEADPSALSNPCGEDGGCVAAYDDASGALLWKVQVYCTHYDPNIELDVQWVFITSLTVSDGHLAVTNERNLNFSIDLRTHEVSGDARGCPAEGTPGSPSQGGAPGGSPQGGTSGDSSQRAASAGCHLSRSLQSASGGVLPWIAGFAAAAMRRRRERHSMTTATARPC